MNKYKVIFDKRIEKDIKNLISMQKELYITELIKI